MIQPNLYKPSRYFGLTFALTFLFWFLSAFFSFREGAQALFITFLLLGLITPFGVALGLTFTSGSAEMKRDFTTRLFDLRLIRLSAFLPSLLIMPFAVTVSALISVLFGGSPEQLRFAEGFSFSVGFVPVLAVLILAAAFEELGWRSYAVESLNVKHNYFWTTILFGGLWSAWHLPLFLVNQTYQNEIFRQNPLFALNFLVGVVPMAVIIGWICRQSRGSIPAAIGFHFVINLSQEALQITQVTKCIETGVLVLIAVAVVLLNRKLFFEK